jgi:hypothetical protein
MARLGRPQIRPQMTIWHMVSNRRTTTAKNTQSLSLSHTHTHRICNSYWFSTTPTRYHCYVVHGDQKVSIHLMIKIQKFTSNVQSVACQSPDIY